jgi:hypothetical protein
MRDATEMETVATYSACHQYTAESTIHFDSGAPSGGPAPKLASRGAAALPAGLHVTLVLTEPIDSGTAAAGDTILEKVRKPVRGHHSKQVLIPAGAMVRGRIIQMRRWLQSPKHFTIGVLLETLEMHGVSMPFYAVLERQDSSDRGMPVYLPLPGQSFLVGTFVVPDGGRNVMRRGYQSEWLTVAPPPPDQANVDEK